MDTGSIHTEDTLSHRRTTSTGSQLYATFVEEMVSNYQCELEQGVK